MPSRLYTTQAKLYDIAFSWDTSEEVEWLLERLGSDCAPILEPACGSGRMLAAFAERGVEAIGIDISPSMVALARERLSSPGLPADALVADMTCFDLGRTFGGAVCPIDSLACLEDPASVVKHLDCMAAHLRSGSRYLIQLEMRDPDDPWAGVRPSIWEAERGDIRLRITWQVEEIDLDEGIELQRSQVEIVAGPDRGRVLEEVHRMAAWTPERWITALAETAFTYLAVYDGDQPRYPRRALGQAGRLLWHELSL